MFGTRLSHHVKCGHSTNWTCPCTCDEEYERDSELGRGLWAPTKVAEPIAAAIPEAIIRYLQHDIGCEANDLDPLDHAPCTCGLREFYNPWNRR